MTLETFIKSMPKAELHVHLEGSIRPGTLLKLAKRHGIALPAENIEDLRKWYSFTDFDHFIEIYLVISSCIQTVEDIELIAREFFAGQAEQNIRYSEVTYTAYTHFESKGIDFEEQIAALNRGRQWALQEFGVDGRWVIDISRQIPAEEGLITTDWVIDAYQKDMGVVALGLGGPEVGHPPEKFTEAFARAHAAGVPSVPHAGETEGPASIWGALNSLHAVRIGHGVRCLEDPELVAALRQKQTVLEVCPTSNVCLGVVPSIREHPIPRLLEEGLFVTVNSDDPPMFNTTLTDEYLALANVFGFDQSRIEQLVLNTLRGSLLPENERESLLQSFAEQFAELRN